MVFQAVLSALLIIFVLLQFGKGAEAGLISGGAADGGVLPIGSKGNPLARITVVLAVLFLVNSLVLAKLQSTRHSKSIMDTVPTTAAPLNSDGKANANGAAPVTPATTASVVTTATEAKK